MQIENLIQGSPEWDQFRLTHYGASEAAAMLGLSKKCTRTELLNIKHSGNPKQFSDWVQENILDHGHEVEALARPLVEVLIGDDLYPVTCSEGIYSASCDGLTLAEDIVFEHKQWNAALAILVRAGILPEEHMPQCQQALMVTGAAKVIFVVSDGTFDNLVHMDVLPDPVWFDRIRAGWTQFGKDLENYQPQEFAAKPIADSILALPALTAQIRGEVVATNLPQFKAAAEQFIANIKTELKTDEDFANAEATVKFCDETEKKLDVAKSAAIAQTASIDELMRTVDHIQAQLRDKRLALEKIVKTRKDAIRNNILFTAKTAFESHVTALEAEILPIRLVYQHPDFAGAMKNKRTLSSTQDAVDTALANAKIMVDAVAKDFRAKLTWFNAEAANHKFLFADLQQIIIKAKDDFELTVMARIEAHDREQAAKEVAAKAALEAAQVKPEPAEEELPQAIAETPKFYFGATGDGVTDDTAAITASLNTTIRLGQITERLGFALTADFLASLGFNQVGRERAAVLYRESDFPKICSALVQHIISRSKA